VQLHTTELRHQPVGNPRRNAPQDEVVDTLLAPAADNVIALAQSLQKQGDVVGIVLKISVHGDDIFAFAVIKSGSERRGLTEVTAQLDDDHAAIDCGDLLQQRERVVATAVVDKHQLKRLAGSLHDDLQAIVKLGDVLFFVMERNNDGILRHRLSIIPSN